MVQVDVFWSYAMGAGLACAAHRQLETIETPSQSPFFVKNLLFLSCLFAPSGVYLLWNFPGWETMFAGDRNLPAWLVSLFAITNVTQGILGFYVSYWLLRRGRVYLANLQWVLGYLAMFFILVHGWDGTGFQRFLYSGTIEQWRAGLAIPWYAFFWSEVAISLYVMGAILLPPLFKMQGGWTMEGYRLADLDVAAAGNPTAVDIVKRILFTILVLTFGAAVVASVCVHLLGWLWGMVVFWAVYAVLGLRPGGLVHKQVRAITLDERV